MSVVGEDINGCRSMPLATNHSIDCTTYRLQAPFLQYVFYHLFNQPSEPIAVVSPTESSDNALLDIFPDHLYLNVHFGSDRLLAQGNLLLRVFDEHKAERAFRVVDPGDRQGGSVDSNVSLGDDKWEQRRPFRCRFR